MINGLLLSFLATSLFYDSWSSAQFSQKNLKRSCVFIGVTQSTLFVSPVWLLGYAACQRSSSLGMLSDALQLPRETLCTFLGVTYQKSQHQNFQKQPMSYVRFLDPQILVWSD